MKTALLVAIASLLALTVFDILLQAGTGGGGIGVAKFMTDIGKAVVGPGLFSGAR